LLDFQIHKRAGRGGQEIGKLLPDGGSRPFGEAARSQRESNGRILRDGSALRMGCRHLTAAAGEEKAGERDKERVGCAARAEWSDGFETPSRSGGLDRILPERLAVHAVFSG
jgi:hypothetical protein